MTLLLIPGLLCDQTVWRHVMTRVPAVVADLRTQSTITEMAEDCLAKTSGPLRVAGHSMGARAAMEIARIAPERVERLALLDTGAHPLVAGEREKREEIIAFANDRGMEALTDRWLPPMVFGPNQSDALMRDLRQMVLRQSPDIHARQVNALIHRPDALSYVPTLTCDTLLMTGAEDSWSPPAQHEQMRDLLPNASLKIIESAGHFAPVERPEVVNEALIAFLSDKNAANAP